MLIMRAVAVVFMVTTCCACMQAKQRYDGTSQPDTPARASDAPVTADEVRRERIVLFAPTALGPLATIDPGARLEFPFALADRVDLLMKGHDGRVGEVLPDSDAPRWNEGRVPATAGAHVVVLTQVLSLNRVKGGIGLGSRPDHVEAVVELRALDVNGVALYRKHAVSEADVSEKPKIVTDNGKPESLASAAALDVAMSDFRAFLSAQNELVNQPTGLANPSTRIAMLIESEPSGADVLIDGAFRGTTPLNIGIPARQVKIRIERQGFSAWERDLVPTADMPIKPALIPLPATVEPPTAE